MRSFHFVFRASGSQTPFSTRDQSVFFWNQLSMRLDRCEALVLMPNHGHLIVQYTDKNKAERAIRLSLLAFQRKTPSLWDPVPQPTSIPDIKHLRRQIRYVHLNPCRSHLTHDPLCWEFSTHWDYLQYAVGLISVPSVRSLGFSSAADFHEFVSSDFTSGVRGTPLPAKVNLPVGFPLVSLDRVAEVACLLTRSNPDALARKGSSPRKLFYSLAWSAGYSNNTQLAKYLKISQQSISELFRRGGAIRYSQDHARQVLCDLRIHRKTNETHSVRGKRG